MVLSIENAEQYIWGENFAQAAVPGGVPRDAPHTGTVRQGR
jgi:hypothetical protein